MRDILQRSPLSGLATLPIKRGLRALIDVLLPPRCLTCGTGLGSDGALCAPCWSEIQFIDGPVCAHCGVPFEFDEGTGALCGGCIQQPPSYRRHRSVMLYNDASRSLILGFKHGDRTEGAPTFGAWLKRAGGDLVQEKTIIVPVPLHRRRLFTRRYNQSALLARGLSQAVGEVIMAPGLLRRTRHTASQGSLSRIARHKNVAGAFRVHPGHAAHVGGRIFC